MTFDCTCHSLFVVGFDCDVIEDCGRDESMRPFSDKYCLKDLSIRQVLEGLEGVGLTDREVGQVK